MQIALLPQLAKDIAGNKVDAAVVLGYPAAAALKDTGIPTVVAVGAGDPVATGLINSLAHPGGNITGISDNAATLSTKRLGLLKQAVPNVQKVAMLWNKSDLGMTLRYQASVDAAKALDVSVQPLGVGEPDDFEDAFAAMDRNPPDAILMVSDPLMILNRARVFNYAAAHRLPAIYENDPYVRAGGLMGTSNNTRCLAISALAERAVAALVPKGVSDRGPFCAGGRPRGPLHDATRTPPVSALKRAQPPPA